MRLADGQVVVAAGQARDRTHVRQALREQAGARGRHHAAFLAVDEIDRRVQSRRPYVVLARAFAPAGTGG